MLKLISYVRFHNKSFLDSISKNLSRILTIRESKSKEGISETVKIKDIMFASTGVIGEKFPTQKIKGNIPDLVDKLRDRHNKFVWFKAASSIMTTDTRPKLAYEECRLWNKDIRLSAFGVQLHMVSVKHKLCKNNKKSVKIRFSNEFQSKSGIPF